MKPIRPRSVSADEQEALAHLYQTTDSPKLRTRAQIILLAIEEAMAPAKLAAITRMSQRSILRWIKRFNAEGIEGLKNAPRPTRQSKASSAYKSQLLHIVRQRPRSLKQPYSLWTLQRLADYMAEQTGERVSSESVRRYLKNGDIVLSRPQHKISSPDPQYEVKKRRLKPNGTT